MDDFELRYYGVVHVLPEEWFGVEHVKGNAIGSAAPYISTCVICLNEEVDAYSLTRSSWLFLGMISSMWGASFGYVSTTLLRIAR